MSKRGDFLEAVFGRAEPFRTVRAAIRQWRSPQLADTPQRGDRPAMGRRKAQTGGDLPVEETNLATWIALPGRMRIEKEHRNGDQVRSSLTVVNGDEWWERDHEGHVQTPGKGRRSSPGTTGVDRHFDRALLRRFFERLDLEGSELVRTAGHECVRLVAVPRPGEGVWPHWLPYGADEYEFHAEPHRGVLLSILGRHAGKVFEGSEVTHVAFDEPLDAALFTYSPAVGEQIRPADPIVEHLTLEAAVARMTFTVLVPTDVPDPEHSHVEVMYHPPRLQSPRANLSLAYRGSGAYENLWVREGGTPDPELDRFEWERLDRAGREMRISDPGSDGMRIVAFEQQGTHVSIWSNLDRERLLQLAVSLVPASKAP